jgi:hypothetical protein
MSVTASHPFVTALRATSAGGQRYAPPMAITFQAGVAPADAVLYTS